MMRHFRGVFVTLPLLVVLAVTGCGAKDGGDGIATAGGSGNPSPSSSASGEKLSDSERAVKFARCMREHGVDMPDPDPDGGPQTFTMKKEEQGKYDAAMKACKAYAPFGGEPPKLDAAQLERMREHAKCMRANGVPDFPDPGPDGGIRIEAGKGKSLDPENPTFKAAMEKCRSLLPKPPIDRKGGDT
ncbi:MAG TPA: hypothetical protein VFR67_05300 [Pilimelia sp.]|nr:hypothetical protein [Pilimelia sp.]